MTNRYGSVRKYIIGDGKVRLHKEWLLGSTTADEQGWVAEAGWKKVFL